MLSRETDADSYKHTKLDYHATVRELPTNERPRERLQHFGPQALSLAELLAIILRTGTRGDNALELANKLLTRYGGLPGLVRADFRELCAEHGMGEAKSAQVKAALEIGRRLGTLHVDARYKITTPADAANLVMLDLAYLDTEQMRILLLDAKGQLVEKISSYQGTANSSVLRAAEVFRPAIIRNCTGLILCHNHPSGDPTPSPEDIEATEQLVEAGRILDIELVDHIIIGHQRFVSLKGHLKWE
jgi:DNA repair protein RadC